MTPQETKELLELAAKAADYKVSFSDEMAGKFGDEIYYIHDRGYPAHNREGSNWWNPLIDDGDALRLAVKLGLAIRPLEKCVFVESCPETLLAFSAISELEMYKDDQFSATRLAITRVAAEIGRKMK